MVTTLEVYCAVTNDWSTRTKIARNLSHILRYNIHPGSKCLLALNWLEEMGYVEKREGTKENQNNLYRDSNKADIEREKFRRIVKRTFSKAI